MSAYYSQKSNYGDWLVVANGKPSEQDLIEANQRIVERLQRQQNNSGIQFLDSEISKGLGIK